MRQSKREAALARHLRAVLDAHDELHRKFVYLESLYKDLSGNDATIHDPRKGGPWSPAYKSARAYVLKLSREAGDGQGGD